MRHDNLSRFYNDEHTREDVESYIFETLDELALEKVYDKEDTQGIADAKEAITNVFIKLGDKYGAKKEKEAVNDSR